MDVRHANFLADISAGFKECRSASLAVAFVTAAGLELVEVAAALDMAIQSRAELRVIVDLTTGNTDPSAVWRLVELAKSHRHISIRAMLPVNETRGLHSKFYLFDDGFRIVLVTGSANLTVGGLRGNVEHGLTVTGLSGDDVLVDARNFFEALWNSQATYQVDDKAARLYEVYCGRLRASLARAERRSRASWRRLEEHLRARPYAISWPSIELAYLFGAVSARGRFDDTSRALEIRLRFNPTHYKDGLVRVGSRSYVAAQVLPQISEHVVRRVREILPGVPVTLERQRVSLDLSDHESVYRTLRTPFEPWSDSKAFHLPRGLSTAEDDIVLEFVRGFAVASALLTEKTSLPGNRLTGLPGTMVVWLRPQAGNKVLFDQLHAVMEQRLGIPVYTHWREYREPHLKIRCEDFREIGFGIPWWDELVEEGAAYNALIQTQS